MKQCLGGRLIATLDLERLQVLSDVLKKEYPETYHEHVPKPTMDTVDTGSSSSNSTAETVVTVSHVEISENKFKSKEPAEKPLPPTCCGVKTPPGWKEGDVPTVQQKAVEKKAPPAFPYKVMPTAKSPPPKDGNAASQFTGPVNSKAAQAFEDIRAKKCQITSCFSEKRSILAY